MRKNSIRRNFKRGGKRLSKKRVSKKRVSKKRVSKKRVSKKRVSKKYNVINKSGGAQAMRSQAMGSTGRITHDPRRSSKVYPLNPTEQHTNTIIPIHIDDLQETWEKSIISKPQSEVDIIIRNLKNELNELFKSDPEAATILYNQKVTNIDHVNEILKLNQKLNNLDTTNRVETLEECKKYLKVIFMTLSLHAEFIVSFKEIELTKQQDDFLSLNFDSLENQWKLLKLRYNELLDKPPRYENINQDGSSKNGKILRAYGTRARRAIEQRLAPRARPAWTNLPPSYSPLD